MFSKVLDKLVGGTVQIVASSAAVVTDYLKVRADIASRERIRKEELRDADHARQIDLRKQGLAADATWELEQIKTSGKKDEYLIGVYTLPAWLCFIKFHDDAGNVTFDGAQIVLDGFHALSQTPGWYQLVLVAISLAPFGIRYWRRKQYDTETPVPLPPPSPEKQEEVQ
jgi:hypothetical protein